MKDNYKQIGYFILLIFFIIVLFFTVISFNYMDNSEPIPSYLIVFVQYHTFFMFFIAIFGIIFGSVTQIITTKKIESDKKKLEILLHHFNNSLTKDEKKIIDYLIKNNGSSIQYELTKLENMNKLKVSRLLIEMENKHFISKEKIGKINKIFLNKDLYGVIQVNN